MAYEISFSFVWGLLKDLTGWVSRRFDNEKDKQRIAHRLKWKAEIEDHSEELRGMKVIIRHLDRLDRYPDTEDGEKGISSWFRAEYWGTYHRGIEVVVGAEGMCKDSDSDEWIICRNPTHKHEFALVVGRIPFDVIQQIDWSGDEYYPMPHFYCEFPRRFGKEPYEVLLISKPIKGHHRDFLEELGEYNKIKKYSKRRAYHA